MKIIFDIFPTFLYNLSLKGGVKMFLIVYQKRNGELIYRTRNSIPGKIGAITSMGWLIKDINYFYKGKYYSASDYNRLMSKQHNIVISFRKLKKFVKNDLWKYALFILYIPLITLYVAK